MSNLVNLADYKAQKRQKSTVEPLNITAEELFATANERNRMVRERLEQERSKANKKLVQELKNEK
jgi:hypothetical protein